MTSRNGSPVLRRSVISNLCCPSSRIARSFTIKMWAQKGNTETEEEPIGALDQFD